MKKVILILLFLLLQQLLLAQTSVWKIEKHGDIIYIGGTIHLLRQSDYPLPKEFETAYNNSDIVYFETNLNALNEPSIQQSILEKMTLKNGKKLSNILSKETYKALEEFSTLRGINLKNYENFKPSMILLTLTVMELKSMGIDTNGVDQFYLEKALKDKKVLRELETVDKHLNYMATLGEGKEDELILQSLEDFKRTKKYFTKIINSWRKGSTGLLYKLFVSDLKRDFPELYNSLLVERNKNWMPIIHSMFQNDKTEFVLVGVAHLVGGDGLIQQLRRKGYKVRQLSK